MRTYSLPEQVWLTPEEREQAERRRQARADHERQLWRKALQIPKGGRHAGKLVGPSEDILGPKELQGGSWALVRRFLGFVKPFRGLVALVLVLMVLVNALQMALPMGLKYTIDLALPSGDLKVLSIIAGGLVALIAVRGLLGFLLGYLVNYSSQRLVNSIRRRVFGQLLAQPISFIEEVQAGGAIARVIGDVDAVSNLLFGSFVHFISNCVRLVIILGVLLAMNWRLTLVSCAFLPAFAWTFVRFRRILRPSWRDIRNEMGGLSAHVGEVFSGARVVKAYVQEQRENLSFLRKINLILRKALYIHRVQVLLDVMAQAVSGLGLVAVIWYGGWEYVNGKLTVGEIAAFNALVAMMFGPVVEVVTINNQIQKALASIERIFEVLDSRAELRPFAGASSPVAIRGEVEFRNVTFRYEKGARPALQQVSFHVEPNQTVAIVGPSGAGKSTLVNLVIRLYDPQEGAVLVDGRDIREYPLHHYRKAISIVLQDNFLFQGTIRDNIAYGMPNATFDEIRRAARMANALEFIEGLEHGFDTLVGERGAHLSGGERQRIAIARAILTNPRILILDEATSSLDSCAEAVIQEALEELMKGRTTFVIAHRLSTVTRADRIFVIDEGRLVDSGSHEELLARPGLYRKLFLEQYGRVKIGREILAASGALSIEGAPRAAPPAVCACEPRVAAPGGKTAPVGD